MRFHLLLLLKVAAAVGCNSQTQGIQLNKALSIGLIVGATVIIER